jgi:putative transposase
VFRLAGSLPLSAIEELRIEREQFERELADIKNTPELKRKQNDFRRQYFERFDTLLDGNSTGPLWLKQTDVAAIVHEAILYRNEKEYDLYASTIMPNHVHMVFSVGRPDWSSYSVKGRRNSSTYIVSNLLENLKWYTALKANQVLKRQGQFWQHESYDHVIRDDKELERTIWYVVENPVKAGLVKSWKKWQWTYCKPELVQVDQTGRPTCIFP